MMMDFHVCWLVEDKFTGNKMMPGFKVPLFPTGLNFVPILGWLFSYIPSKTEWFPNSTRIE